MDDEEEIEDGEICDVCGVPIFFYGSTTAECPNCGQSYRRS
jgi:predicted RNA-binding Zn-ribbon protein involved in translation (DUF1610 family)